MRKPSPATIIATVALFVALGGVGVAATGGNFTLGQSNTATTPTSLSAPVAGGKALQVTNNDTSNAASTALGLNVANGHAPFTVNTGVKVLNLNSDKLDGLDSTGFLPKAGTAANSTQLGGHQSSYYLPTTGKAVDADKLDGLNSSSFARTDVVPPWNVVSGTTTSGEPGKFACQGTSSFCWHNYGSPWGAAAFMKDALGFVHLKGLVQCTVAGFSCDTGLSSTIFVLPTGYRPSEQGLFPSVSYDGNTHTVARIDVTADGRVIPVQGVPAKFMTLDGITFQATQ